jgi:hypothetical protein
MPKGASPAKGRDEGELPRPEGLESLAAAVEHLDWNSDLGSQVLHGNQLAGVGEHGLVSLMAAPWLR